MKKLSFIDDAELVLSTEFQEKGYLIVPVDDPGLLVQIRALVAAKAATFLGAELADPISFLNEAHGYLNLDQLNALRLDVIRSVNAEPWFRAAYFRLARSVLEKLVGNELAMICPPDKD